MRKRLIIPALGALIASSLMTACSDEQATTTETAASEEQVEAVEAQIAGTVTYDEADRTATWEESEATAIELSGSEASFAEGAPVYFQDGTLTIKAGGTYVLSGTLDGQIVVEAEDKATVRLVLNGVTVTSDQTAAIAVNKAEKTVVTLAEGTENHLSDGGEGDSSEEPNAALFSKSDLTINGAGALDVTGNKNNGIASKDQLKIMSGTIAVTSVDDGIIGRDLIALAGGDVTVTAGGDGVKSTNDENAEKGSIVLENGTLTVTAAGDGIQSEQAIYAAAGTYHIEAGGGSPDTIAGHEEQMGGFSEGTASVETEAATDSEASMKGIKAVSDVVITGGMWTVNAADDAFHSNADVTIGGGDYTIASGDDAVHADAAVTISGGDVAISKSYEGVEGAAITIEGGQLALVASDDGLNVGGGNDGSGMDASAVESGVLTITGGEVTVDASGDGLDSNGSIEMSGGTVFVSGPVNAGNGALDYDSSFNLTGGVLAAAGSAGMVQSVSDSSTQASVVMLYPETQSGGTEAVLKNSDGEAIFSYAPEKDYEAIVISTPDLTVDDAYTLLAGKEEVVSFTLENNVTWLDETGVTDAQSGQAPGGGGMRGGDGDGGPFGGADVDEATRAQMEDIMQQLRDGTITQEEADAKLQELGVEMPGGIMGQPAE